MEEEKITPSMTTKNMIMVMSEGHPGALYAVMQILDRANSYTNILLCDSLNIRGVKLYKLHSDCCDRNPEKLKRTLSMLKCGIFSEDQIDANLSLKRPIPFIDDNIGIKGIPSYGHVFGPTHSQWKEFCVKNVESFEERLAEAIQEQRALDSEELKI